MKIVYLSNIFHHLQKPLSDELYKITNGEYLFVESGSMTSGLAYQGEKAQYVIPCNKENASEIEKLVYDADVVIYGEAPLFLVKRRLCERKLTFRDDERRYKQVNRYLKWPIYTFKSLYLNKGYLLCASAFASRDYALSGMSISKCFKWGYFPAAIEYDDIDQVIINKRSNKDGVIQIFWTGRLITLKHPESVLYVAEVLKAKGYSFEIKIVGDGPGKSKLERGIVENGLENNVKMLGKQPPAIVRSLMEESDIYLFTSDRGEGWGAVLNESMNSACAVVASPATGSAPFLIEDNKNGIFFKDRDWKDLSKQVVWLIEHPDERVRMQRAAYLTIANTWNPHRAANNLIELVSSINEGRKPNIAEGPCSSARYLSQNWR